VIAAKAFALSWPRIDVITMWETSVFKIKTCYLTLIVKNRQSPEAEIQ
jgi:hypothetical protein